MTRRRVLVVSLLAVALAGLAAASAALGLVPGLLGRYRAPIPALAAAFRAREACACLFVDGRSEADCVEWTRASPEVARLAVDRPGRAVSARALGLWRARARWRGPRQGCVLEE